MEVKEFDLINYLKLDSYLLLSSIYHNDKYYSYYDNDINEKDCIAKVRINTLLDEADILIYDNYLQLSSIIDEYRLSQFVKLPFSKLKVISIGINSYDYTTILLKKELDLNKLFGIHEDEFYLELLLNKLEVSISVRTIDNNGKLNIYCILIDYHLQIFMTYYMILIVFLLNIT